MQVQTLSLDAGSGGNRRIAAITVPQGSTRNNLQSN